MIILNKSEVGDFIELTKILYGNKDLSKEQVEIIDFENHYVLHYENIFVDLTIGGLSTGIKLTFEELEKLYNSSKDEDFIQFTLDTDNHTSKNNTLYTLLTYKDGNMRVRLTEKKIYFISDLTFTFNSDYLYDYIKNNKVYSYTKECFGNQIKVDFVFNDEDYEKILKFINYFRKNNAISLYIGLPNEFFFMKQNIYLYILAKPTSI